MTCTESTNDDPVDCRKIEARISAANQCLSARADMTSRCFDGRWNWKRQSLKEETELMLRKCTEVLNHKKNKSLCK